MITNLPASHVPTADAPARHRPRARLLTAFAATLVLVGCAPNVGPQSLYQGRHPEAPAMLTVQNTGPFATRILFARQGGVEVPLATIGAGETRTLRLSGFVTDLGPVSFVARGRAARDEVRTEHLLIHPGDQVDWLLERVGVGSRSPAPLRVVRAWR
jgi:hypothetical protein